ncbi:MAG: phosphate signaling complex protein PhoU [Chloroflexota bacterium]
MTRDTLDKKIKELCNEVLELGQMVVQMTLDSVESLKKRDVEAAHEVYARDLKINNRRFEIERDCLIVIATQQPMATDLRVLAAILEIITELERMGDYAKGIARINIQMGSQPLLKPLIDVPRMAELGSQMLIQALEAFVAVDVEQARQIPQQDDMIDGLYNQVYRELLTYMISDPRTIDQATHLLWVAHNLERLADRVTNICERIVFVATGELIEMDRSDDEIRAQNFPH